jgi:signal transduction histidine kinase
VKVVLREEKNGARVSIQDYGIGISREDQKEIFKRFYRVMGHEERTFPGLGIGLYISSEIVRRHGSELKVSSVKGKGSKFSFKLSL